MMKSKTYRHFLKLDNADGRRVVAVAKATGQTVDQVLITSIRKGLSLARKARSAPTERITSVPPLPDSAWRQIYSQKDYLDSFSPEVLRKVQSQRKPE